ncbi:hypothetical protein GCM10023193_23380 [Planotetraspora kaengkrachanensis]|uniref:Uncharacterized protein n=2 Tax=Planotetraspora kaengkrachanensis TaxID=575193 RepID=A0A8J3M8Q8_9ACTN|nr:hypothetical protein Pka01_30770 [Planotetraspora kaengkrachanensis]
MAEITGYEATARGATGPIQAAGKVQSPLHPQNASSASGMTSGSIQNVVLPGMPTGHPHSRLAVGPDGAAKTNHDAGDEKAGVLAGGRHAARPGAATAPDAQSDAQSDAATLPDAQPDAVTAAAPDAALPDAKAVPDNAAPADAAQGSTAGAKGVAPGRQVMEPTAVPPPSGPSRVYGQLIILRTPEAAPQPAAGKAQPATAGKATPVEKKDQDELTCALDWQDTWLWDLCKERGGKS